MHTVSTSQKYINEIDSPGDFAPILIREIELSQSLAAISAFDVQTEQLYQRMRCLVRLHTQPLGLVEFSVVGDEVSPEQYLPYIWLKLGEKINAHLREDGLPEVTALEDKGLPYIQPPKCIQEREDFLPTAPFVSVVISTHERPDRLARCLSALLKQQYADYEVIVVDNAPSTSATIDFIEHQYANEPKIRYIREDRPGLSAGRNRGVVEARGDIIAITDDDVVVDTYWLVELVRGFKVTDNVVCVTGLLLPLELDTSAQMLFEAYGGFSRGFSRRIFDLREHRWKKPAYPYIVGVCGSGASMAFTAKFLQEMGGFDPALGTGTPTHGGEDLAAFFHVIIHGYRLVYQPTSLLYHQHRREYSSLQKQVYGYGVGLTAYLTKIIFDHPWLLLDCLNKFIRSLLFLRRYGSARPEEEPGGVFYPRELKQLGRKGLLRGPLAYVQSRWKLGWARKGLPLAQMSALADRANTGIR